MITSRASQRVGIRVSKPLASDPKEDRAAQKATSEHLHLSDPRIFGPGKWDDIHTYAVATITPERKKAFCDYIRIITSSLKCLFCRKHATDYVRLHPPEEFMDMVDEQGRHIGLFEWTRLFHNTVNRRLGKPELDFKTAYALFEPDINVCVKDCGEEEVEVEKLSGADKITAELNAVPAVTPISDAPEYNYSVLGRSVAGGKAPEGKVPEEVFIPTYTRAPSPKRATIPKIRSR